MSATLPHSNHTLLLYNVRISLDRIKKVIYRLLAKKQTEEAEAKNKKQKKKKKLN